MTSSSSTWIRTGPDPNIGPGLSGGEKTALWRTGTKATPALRKKLSEAKIGYPGPNKGRKFSLETRRKQSLAHIGQKHTEESKEKRSKAMRGRTCSPEHNRNVSKSKMGHVVSAEQREKERISHLGKTHSEETKRKKSLLRIKYMKEHHIPVSNGKEKELALFLTPYSYKFVGDGQLWIGGKCPDFWNGDHKLIELYGDYWHRDNDPNERISHFEQFGFDCLVIWEHELDNREDLRSKIGDF